MTISEEKPKWQVEFEKLNSQITEMILKAGWLKKPGSKPGYFVYVPNKDE